MPFVIWMVQNCQAWRCSLCIRNAVYLLNSKQKYIQFSELRTSFVVFCCFAHSTTAARAVEFAWRAAGEAFQWRHHRGKLRGGARQSTWSVYWGKKTQVLWSVSRNIDLILNYKPYIYFDKFPNIHCRYG